jgi:hypothetical protein
VREDYLEQLDKMFPEGYVIAYTNPDGNMRMSLFNPFKYKLIEDIRLVLSGFKDTQNDD